MPITNELNASRNEVSRPEILYRSFTVSVPDLSVDMFEGPLIPGSEADPTTGLMTDGNELGVYMTTNYLMAKTAYASSADHLECPRYNSGRGITNTVDLPRCGVTVEVDTNGLDIRPPKISSQMQPVYNNGFAGDEWIADQVPRSNYRVKSLSLSTYATDRSRVSIEITPDQPLEDAIAKIKSMYAEKLELAEKFITFLNTLDDRTRMNEFLLSRKWEQYQVETKGN